MIIQLSVVIPNYNGLELLKKNLPEVIKKINAETNNYELIIVDDNSKDESIKFLENFFKKKEYQKIKKKILKNEKNLGFSKTVNKAVLNSSYDFVLLLNTDVVPESKFLSPLFDQLKGEVFGVGCLDKSIEYGKTVLRGRGIGSWKKGFLVHSAGSLDKKDTLWVSGGSGVFNKKIWEKLGGMSELYSPFYWEDIDICYRALKSGYPLIFESKSRVIHRHEEGSIKSEYSAEYIKMIAYRNQLIFVWKNATDFDIILSHVFWLPYHFVKAFLRRDFIFFKAFVCALFRSPSILIERLAAIKKFKKKDREVVLLN